MPANRVRDIYVGRIKQLMSLYEASKAIDHSTTVGAMREAYLKTFLREMLPLKFRPVSGFLADMHGRITPQIDMIFFDRSELPTVSLVEDTVIVPWEIALLAIEVKSTLKPKDLDQLERQRVAFRSMQDPDPGEERTQFLTNAAPPWGTRKRPNVMGWFIMTFESEIGEQRLEEWVRSIRACDKDHHPPAGVCVLGSTLQSGQGSRMFSAFSQIISEKDQDPIEVLRDTEENGPYEPLLAFVGAIHRCLHYLSLNNSTMSDLEWKRVLDSHGTWLWEGYLSERLYQQVQRFRSQG